MTQNATIKFDVTHPSSSELLRFWNSVEDSVIHEEIGKLSLVRSVKQALSGYLSAASEMSRTASTIKCHMERLSIGIDERLSYNVTECFFTMHAADLPRMASNMDRLNTVIVEKKLRYNALVELCAQFNLVDETDLTEVKIRV